LTGATNAAKRVHVFPRHVAVAIFFATKKPRPECFSERGLSKRKKRKILFENA
jgi:hypothetical protein